MKNLLEENNMLILDLETDYCNNSVEVLNSNYFKTILESFIKKNKNRPDYELLLNNLSNKVINLIDVYKLLLSFKFNYLSKLNTKYKNLENLKDILYNFTEDLYDYYRRISRYSFITSKIKHDDMLKDLLLEQNKKFTDLILKTYRLVCENIIDVRFNLYRELPSGVNASFLLNEYSVFDKDSYYSKLNKVKYIESLMIRPPFISYSKKNKRTGVYKESFNKVNLDDFVASDYLLYPIYVGDLVAFLYFNKKFINHAVSISNLFEGCFLANINKIKPNLVYIFGYGNSESTFYYDKDENMYFGIAPLSFDVDYFGYLKKMLLTLHNVSMIKNGNLPIHGACVNITFSDLTTKTVVIVGDSGAGKSETLEALNNSLKDNILSIKTIFDDMGTFRIKDNQVYAYGTEIGAFVRIDDMADGYQYREIDRAIFLNPDKSNARLVIPVSSYDEIIKGYKVDTLLYANNYDNKDEIKVFNNVLDAKKVFIEGKRFAKGTTFEEGLVTSFFANPFGPVQKEEETKILIDKYFDLLFKNNIILGEMYTKLGIKGFEKTGPENISLKLFKLLKEN